MSALGYFVACFFVSLGVLKLAEMFLTWRLEYWNRRFDEMRRTARAESGSTDEH